MKLAFSELPCPPSLVRRLDPRWKLAAVLLAIAAVVSLRQPLPAGVALVGALGLAALSRLPPRWLGVRLGVVALFLSLFVLSSTFLLRGPGPEGQLGPLTLSAYGLSVGVVIFAKGLTIVTLALVLLATAPLDATLKAAHALYAPGLVVQLVLLAYRYVYVVADELARLRVALRTRGFRSRPNGHTYRTIGNVTGALLVRSHDRAERVGWAMRCRGFDGRFRSLTEFRTTAKDVLALVLIVAAAAALVVWDWRIR